METAKDPSTNAIGGSLLRYPLRSATKSKDVKMGTEEPNATPATRTRLKSTPIMAKSVDRLDLSGKDMSVKYSRRVPSLNKPTNSPHSITTENLTPISENQRNGLNTPVKSDTPRSDSSKSSHRRKFCVLSSVSYWLGQIKLSESVSKHSISLGFFRLALESGVEPLNRIREELNKYVLRHNLLEELGNTTKDILNIFDIAEDLEKLQISESHAQLAEDVNQNLDEVPRNFAMVPRGRNLKPKFASINTLVDSNKKEGHQNGNGAIIKAYNLRNQEKAALLNQSVGNSTLETSRKPKKLQTAQGSVKKMKGSEKNSVCDEDDSANEEPKLNDKENKANKNQDIYSSEEVIQAN